MPGKLYVLAYPILLSIITTNIHVSMCYLLDVIVNSFLGFVYRPTQIGQAIFL